MAASNGKIGKGTTLGYSATSNGTFTTLAEVFELPFPEFEAADVDVTHYASPNGIEEYIPGWQTGQDMEIQLNYTSAAYAVLLGLQGTKQYFKITLPDGTTTGSTLVFQANVKKVGGAIPNKDKITNTVTLKPSSAVTFTAGT